LFERKFVSCLHENVRNITQYFLFNKKFISPSFCRLKLSLVGVIVKEKRRETNVQKKRKLTYKLPYLGIIDLVHNYLREEWKEGRLIS